MRLPYSVIALCILPIIPAAAFEYNGFQSDMSLKSATTMSNANGWNLNDMSFGTKRNLYVQSKGPGGRDGTNMVLFFCRDTSKLVALSFPVDGGARAFAEQTEKYQGVLGPGEFKSQGKVIGSLRSVSATWIAPQGYKITVSLNIGDIADGGGRNALSTMVTLDSQECQEPED